MPGGESQHGERGAKRYALPLVLLGLFLFAASFLPVLASGRERWTKEQALELQQASMRIQELTHELGKQTPDTASKTTSDQFQEALDHFENLQAQLKDARGHSGSLKAVLRVVGLLFFAVGAAGLALSKRKKSAELRPVHTVRTP